MDFWKKDFIKANGYDETFIGWGHEDAELLARLYSSGLKKCVIHLGGFVYHLDHKSRASESKNFDQLERRLQETIEKKRVWAENGVDKYL